MIERLAVTKEQIADLELPRKPIKESTATGSGGVAYNRQVTEWEEQHGADATELNALERYTDPKLPQKNREQGDAWEDDVEERIAERLREAGVDEDLEELERWVADFNEAYAAVADVFERLRGLMDDDSALGEWEAMVEELIGETEFPIATVPDGDAALPSDPIYDSSRSYVENKARIDRYRVCK